MSTGTTFNFELWISDDVTMEGEPDLDGDGDPHSTDTDEREAFRAAQVDWIEEMRARMGDDFIRSPMVPAP
ncbi:MAG: hypothetical protein IPG61_20185 [bacterium]|nr:hypothetical protein [bacterium]